MRLMIGCILMSGFPSDCKLGLSDNGSYFDISHRQKHPHILDISSDSKSETNNNHTILYANSSEGIDGSDGFCKEDCVRKFENFIKLQRDYNGNKKIYLYPGIQEVHEECTVH